MSDGSSIGTGQLVRMGKAMVCTGLAGFLAWSGAGAAQPLPQKAQVQAPVPGTRFEPPAGAVVDDPNRVFGDEGPDFAPLAIVGALGITPYAAVDVTYDDNAARVNDDGFSFLPFRSKDDWIFRPSVGARLERDIGQQRLFANASIGRIIYARNSFLNANRFNVGGGLGFNLGRSCGGQLTAGYNTRDQLIGGFAEAGPVQTESTTFSGSLSCTTMTGFVAGGAYSRGSNTNRSNDPAIDRSFADSRFESVSGNVGYQIARRGQVGVTASWANNVFPNQVVLGEENSNTIKSYGLYGNYRVGNRFSANASIGQTRVETNALAGGGFTGGTWGMGLSYSGSRLGANLSTGRSVNGGGNLPANFVINQFFNGSVTYQANEALRFSAGASRADQNFRGTVGVPQTGQLQEVKVDRVLLGADYALGRLLTLTLDLIHQRRSAVPEQFSFTSNTATLGIQARF